MSANRAVTYMGPGKVEIRDIDFPELELRDGPGVHPANLGRKCEHGVILKVVSTNICGSVADVNHASGSADDEVVFERPVRIHLPGRDSL